MSREPRIEYPGAFYHVLARGNNKEDIFKDEQDYNVYLDRVKKYQERYKFTLYSFVLMSNHVHLLMETGLIAKAGSLFVFVAVRCVGFKNKSVAGFLGREFNTISYMIRI